MRTIQTFVLRLLVDEDEPNTLRGSLRSVATDEENAFADAQVLLRLLRQAIALPAETRRAERAQKVATEQEGKSI